MDQQRAKLKQQQRRRWRVRGKFRGTSSRPRLSVFRSSKHIYAQIIDDMKGETLVSASSRAKKGQSEGVYGGNIKAAALVGQRIAEVAKEKGIQEVAFDRGHYKYHGRIKALADAAREAGLKF